MSPEKKIPALFKWIGGKRWLAPSVEKIYKPYRDRRWVDPFCGALSLPLYLKVEKALLNDINPFLIELYQNIKKGEYPVKDNSCNTPSELYYYFYR